MFSLDILSHRMSAMTMLRQLKKQLRLRAWNSAPRGITSLIDFDGWTYGSAKSWL